MVSNSLQRVWRKWKPGARIALWGFGRQMSHDEEVKCWTAAVDGEGRSEKALGGGMLGFMHYRKSKKKRKTRSLNYQQKLQDVTEKWNQNHWEVWWWYFSSLQENPIDDRSISHRAEIFRSYWNGGAHSSDNYQKSKGRKGINYGRAWQSQGQSRRLYIVWS